MCKRVNRQGAKVIISSRNETELERVKSECMYPENIQVVPIDLSDAEKIDEAWKEVVKRAGSIDILINNAGLSQRSSAIETKDDVARKIMEVNFFSAVKLTKLVLHDMIERNRGHIVVISSLVGKFGTPKRSSYSASKHAIQGYFESLRAEVWKNNIRVSLICPGYVRTNISVNAIDASGGKHGKMDQNQQKGRSPDACAKAIVKAIKRNKREVYFGGKEIIAIYLKRFFPYLLWKIVKKLEVK